MDLLGRLLASVDITGDCWVWRGYTRAGYGCLSVNARPHNAHRISWELHRGAIPPGMCVLHRCDVKRCINPEHLFLGTLADNCRDRASKGRTRNQYMDRTECRYGHPIDAGPTRHCKTCQIAAKGKRRLYLQEWRLKRKAKLAREACRA